MPKHFVLSRLGLGIYDDQWFRAQIDLFEAVTFGSIAQQSCQDFEFLLVVDVGLEGALRDRLHALMASKRNFHLISIDTTRMTFMRLGELSWIFEPCRNYLLERCLIIDPTEFILTSTIDSDDAWHRDFVSDINSVAADRLPGLIASEPARGTYVGHSAGLAITQQNGQKLFLPAKVTEPMASQFHSTTVSILARFSSGISAWSSRHIAWPYMAYVLMFETVNIETPDPRWVYVRHQRSVQPWDVCHPVPLDGARLNELERNFGIDLKKLDRWIETYCSLDSPDHAGRSFRNQVDRMFQLTALNRQIELLERRMHETEGKGSERGVLVRLVTEQKAKRAALVQSMREI